MTEHYPAPVYRCSPLGPTQNILGRPPTISTFPRLERHLHTILPNKPRPKESTINQSTYGASTRILYSFGPECSAGDVDGASRLRLSIQDTIQHHMELPSDDISVYLGISASQYSPATQHEGIREMEEAQDAYPETHRR